jgi:hypothetical protein
MNATTRTTEIQSESIQPEALLTEHTTWRPLSKARWEGIQWAERLFAQASSASNDVARFAAGLAE